MKKVSLLSKTSAMGCWSWSLPSGPKYCAGFNWSEGSICRSCYAMQGRYRMPNVQYAQETRWRWWNHAPREERIRALSTAIQKCTKKNPYFRVFDSGDFSKVQDVHDWIAIARRCPETRFWIPTRAWSRPGFGKPLMALHSEPHVTVRLSLPEIGVSVKFSTTLALDFPASRTAPDTPGCPKQVHPGGSCQAAECRACWDKTVPLVTYRQHGHPVKLRLTPAA